jgi:hypothetical protein
MANDKKVFSASDAAPTVLYAKTDPASELAYPVLIDANGSLAINAGWIIPNYDQQIIDESASPNVTITYKKNGSTVATKSIVVSGTTTTITVT